MTSGAGNNLFVRHLLEPALTRGAGGIELGNFVSGAVVAEDVGLHVLMIVVKVSEQPGEEVHVPNAGKCLLRELWEVEHRDLAILLLHLLDFRPGRENYASSFENVTYRPGIRGNSCHLLLLHACRLRASRGLCGRHRRCQEASDGTAASALQKAASVRCCTCRSLIFQLFCSLSRSRSWLQAYRGAEFRRTGPWRKVRWRALQSQGAVAAANAQSVRLSLASE